MTAPLTITIPGASLPSWNQIMRLHHHEQHAAQTTWIMSVLAAIDPDAPRFYKLVTIRVTSYQKGRLIDPDNIYVKGAIDGVKRRLLPDDSPRWVHSVTLCSRKDARNPRVEIQIQEVGA